MVSATAERKNNMRFILLIIALITLMLLIKENKKGGLLEWAIIVIGIISGVSMLIS